MSQGKPSGIRCIHLDQQNLCKLFLRPERPQVCANFKADDELCGNDSEQAIRNILHLEQLTTPSR